MYIRCYQTIHESTMSSYQDIIRSSSPLSIPHPHISSSDMQKPDVYFVGCSSITHSIIDTLCSNGESLFPYRRIFLFDTRNSTILERSRVSRWNIPQNTDEIAIGSPEDPTSIDMSINHSIRPKSKATTPTSSATQSPQLTSTKHTLAQLCKITFQDRIPSVPITIIDSFQSEFPANITIVDKLIVYTDVGIVNVTTQKRIEEQVSNPLQLYYLFQNGLFAIYQNGYVWKNRFSLAYHITHSGMKLNKEGCDLYVDYLRMVKKYKDSCKDENIYDLPSRFYKYKLNAQCFPLGTILAMMYVSGQPTVQDYPLVFDYSSLYSETLVDNAKGKDDSGLIFPREALTLLKDKVHWIQSFDKNSELLYTDLLSYLEWTCTISEKGKSARVYLLCNDSQHATNSTRKYAKSLSVLKDVRDQNTQKGYTMRHADWIWRLDTTDESLEKNMELTQLIYDYYKPAVVLSDIKENSVLKSTSFIHIDSYRDTVKNAIVGDIVIPKKLAIPQLTTVETISHRRMAMKRITLAFSFMNWIYIVQNPLYMEQFARSHILNIAKGNIEIVCPEEAYQHNSTEDVKTQPYQFTEWFRWKAELHRDSCITVKNLVEYIVDTYDIYPHEIYYEEEKDENCIYKKQCNDIDNNTKALNVNILSWIKQNIKSRSVIRSFDVYRFILVCNDEQGNRIIVPPLYYCAP